MIILGVTGQIASGKTTAAEEFSKNGGKIISADNIGRQVVENNPPVMSKLIRAFGRNIVTPEGILKRRELGKITFVSQRMRNKLNSIVHPPLLKILKAKIDDCRKSPDCELLIIDAALLIDWNLHHEMDYTVCVVAPRKVQLQRLCANSFSPQEANDRIKSQKTAKELCDVSDFKIINDGSLDDLRAKVGEIYKKIIELTKSNN